jgi:hypothetical protein
VTAPQTDTAGSAGLEVACTPGPWSVANACDQYVSAGGFWIASTMGVKGSKGAANARLIAAAPCLARDLNSAWAVLSLILENGWVPEQHRAPVEQCRDNAAAALSRAGKSS